MSLELLLLNKQSVEGMDLLLHLSHTCKYMLLTFKLAFMSLHYDYITLLK